MIKVFNSNAWRLVLPAVLVIAFGVGCGSDEQRDRGFFTSGNREADQRADQRMAKSEQLQGDKNLKANAHKASGADQATGKKTLYERLGSEPGIKAIVEDFVPRVLADPRVNWERKGVTRGGFSIHRNQSEEWKATPDNQAKLKLHLEQFLALATGGPTKYEGQEMKAAHANMHIANPEFDAAIGDLKATLDKLQIPNQEQKELLSIVESTRPQIVEERG